MKVVSSPYELVPDRPTAVTVGGFDGVHVAHQTLLEEMVRIARMDGLRTLVFTFEIPPKALFSNEGLLLSTPAEKVELLRARGVDYLILARFEEVKEVSPWAFVEDFLIRRYRARRVILGFNHRFGKDRKGDLRFLVDHLPKWGFILHALPPIRVEGETVSSSLIRRLLLNGQVEQAARLLGRPYEVRGEVIPARGIGRELGFPTANLQVPPRKLLPKVGVYAVRVHAKGRWYRGAANIGLREGHKHLEVHILDFSGELYGEELRVHFLRWVREERRFPDRAALRAQIARDVARIREMDLESLQEEVTPSWRLSRKF